MAKPITHRTGTLTRQETYARLSDIGEQLRRLVLHTTRKRAPLSETALNQLIQAQLAVWAAQRDMEGRAGLRALSNATYADMSR